MNLISFISTYRIPIIIENQRPVVLNILNLTFRTLNLKQLLIYNSEKGSENEIKQILNSKL